MTTANFDLLPREFQTQPVKVYTRPTWAAAWTERPDIIPLEAQWTLSPDPSTATLFYKFGRVKVPGAIDFTNLARITTRGYYVLLEYPDDTGAAPWYWLGYAESPIDGNLHPARDGLPEAGDQTIPCFGFLEILKQAIIVTLVHVSPGTPTDLKRSLGGGTFNKDEKGNRDSTKKELTEGDDTSDQAYGFALPDETDPDFWSTRDIIEHLFAFHLPSATGLKGSIPFGIQNLNLLPDWDRPTVDTEGRSVFDILQELVTEEQLLTIGFGATATPGSPPTITSVDVVIQTTVSSDLTLPAFGTVPANTVQFDIINTTDPNTIHDVNNDDSEVVDQVIVRGPREIGIGTFTINELEKNWTVGEQSAYEDGGRGYHPNFANLPQYEQREQNDIRRDLPELQKVYRRLRLKKDWDGKTTGNDLFTPEDPPQDPPVTYIPYLGTARFMDHLPLYAGVDYSVATPDETSGQDMMQPIVGLLNPDSNRIDNFSRFGPLKMGFSARKPDAIDFTIRAQVNNDNGPKVDLLVGGVPNHAIAGSGFIGNVADVDQDKTFGGFDYDTVEATLAMENDRRPFWAIPDQDAVKNLDVVRRMIITSEHPALQLLHIANGTTVSFDNEGNKVTSPGGVVRDPTDIIKSLTTMHAEFFTKPRRRLTLQTLRRPTVFQLGGIVTTVSNYTGSVDSVIRSIAVRTPLTTNGNRGGQATVNIVAASVRFDPMQLLSTNRKFTSEPEAPSNEPTRHDKVVQKRNERAIDRIVTRISEKVGIAEPNRA